ncbi:MAG TPA: cohesin domain-containing protein [bacterium]|nr:cohesin domain-containing protein [bacterium]
MNKNMILPLLILLVLYAAAPAANYNAIHASDSLNIWVAGNGGLIKRSTDGGKSWQEVSTKKEHTFYDIFSLSAQNAIAVGSSSYSSDSYYLTAETIDGGKNWLNAEVSGSGLHQAEAVSVTQHAETKTPVYVIAKADGKLLYSTGPASGSRVWESGHSESGVHFLDVHMIGNYGWAVCTQGIIYKTYNYGKEWWRKDSGVDSDIAAVHFADIDHGWAATYGGEVLSTTDAGETWRAKKIDNDILTGIHFCDTQNGIVVSATGHIFHTQDGGSNWQGISHSLGADKGFMDVVMLSPRKAWAAGWDDVLLPIALSGDAAAAVVTPNTIYNGTLPGRTNVYYAVPVSVDGNLTVTLTPGSGANIQLMICTPEKKEIVRGDSWGSPFTLSVNGLKPDTYFISLYGYYDPSSNIAFSLQTQYAVAALADDPEPNDAFANAKILPLNGSVTGHVGYDGRRPSNPADQADWWQVSTTEDGALTVTITQIEPVNLQLALCKPDGNTEIMRADTWGDTTRLTIENLRNGAYFVRVYKYAWNYTPYTLHSSFVPAPGKSDAEPNDTAAAAVALSLTAQTDGHLGYDGFRDSLAKDVVDWWHFTLTSATDLKIKLTQAGSANLRMQLYGADAVSVVHNGSDTWGAGYEMNVSGAAAGKYYLKIMTYGVHDSYSINETKTPATLQTISAAWGPPAQLSVWQSFTVPLTAAAFGIDDATFAGVLSSVSKVRFRTEMYDGADVGKLDVVRIGDRFFSDFRSGEEEWVAEGDGTLSWMDSGGSDGNGYIQVADWASGDWHYATAPPSWSGDWTALIGQNITFAYQTNHHSSDYRGIIEISNEPVKRLLLTTSSWTLAPGGSGPVTVKLSQALSNDLTVQLSNSNPSTFTVAASLIIKAGQTSGVVMVNAAPAAVEGSTAVITASASGFPDARLTLTIRKESDAKDGIGVRVNVVDTENFPTLSCWISAIDLSDNTPIVNISPAQITLSEDGSTQTASRVEKAGPGMGGKVDIVFVVDATLASNRKEKLAAWARCIDDWVQDPTVGIDSRYALVAFAGDVEMATGFSNDFAEIQAQIEGITPRISSDGKANALNGLAKVLEIDFRANAVRMAVLLTDKPYYQQGISGAGSTTLTTITAAHGLYFDDIIPIVIAPDQPDFHTLAQEAEGLFLELNDDRLAEYFCRIGRLLASQTVVTYATSDRTPDDDVRTLNLTVKVDDKSYTSERVFVVGSSKVLLTPANVIGKTNYTFELAVEVRNIVDLGLVHFYLQYDPAKIEPVQVKEGDFLNQGGSQTTFVSTVEAGNSRIDISATRLNTAGVGASGSGVLCTVTFQVRVPDCGSAISISSTDQVFRKLNNTAIPVVTAAATLHPISAGGTSSLLGDFDKDLDIDTRDFALLSTYWKPNNTATGDIGPADGTPPFLTVTHDHQVNFEDLFVFTRMWNWFHSTLKKSPATPAMAKTAAARLDWRLQPSGNPEVQRYALIAQGMEHLSMGHIVLRVPAAAWRIIDIQPGELMTGASAWLVDRDDQHGEIDIAFSRLAEAGESPAWCGTGSLIELQLAPLADAAGELQTATADLRQADGDPLAVAMAAAFPLTVQRLPLSFNLEANYPNPFNHSTRIAFSVPTTSPVSICVYDMLGRPVKELVNRSCSMGQYSLTWDGTREDGQPVGSGLYWLRMESGAFQQTRRMLLLK